MREYCAPAPPQPKSGKQRGSIFARRGSEKSQAKGRGLFDKDGSSKEEMGSFFASPYGANPMI